MSFKKLFTPINIGKVKIKNRCAMAPMGMGPALYATDETWPQQVIRYYEERAKGGLGLIITGFVRVHPQLASHPIVGLYDDKFIPTHKQLIQAVHKHDAKIFHQVALMGGRFGKEAPSSIYSDNYPEKPRALTTEEIDGLVESFIQAAVRGKVAGYDGVEVHGGHTYFIGQLMSPATNKRTDKYGGSFENRMRFITEVIKGIQEKCPGHPVGVKFSMYEELEGGIDIELGKRIAKHIGSLGIDYLHVSVTSSANGTASKYPSVSPMYLKRNTLVGLAEIVKKECPDKVVMATGSITIPREADSFITGQKCDMVVLGRTVLADPHWANKAQKKQNIIPCIRCNVCYNQLWEAKPLRCSMNPYLLKEAEQGLSKPAKKKTVMIVGAGPAGLQCAITADKRGHEVLLYEKLSYIGGMIYPGSRPEFKTDVARALDYFEQGLKDSGVKLHLNTEVTPGLIEEVNPDVLVVAMGAKPIIPDIEGIESEKVITAIELMKDISKASGSRAAVIGGGEVGCEAACYLSDNGFDVTIVEILPRILTEDNNVVMKAHLIDLLEQKNIKILTETTPNKVVSEGLEVILPNGKQSGVEADTIVVAINQLPENEFIRELCFKAEEYHIIGDCKEVRQIKDAVYEGEEIARLI